MWGKKKSEVANEIIEQPAAEIEKKGLFGLVKRKEKDIAAELDQLKVREHDGPFKHKVTGKEFNLFVLETQSAIIQIKQDMLSFTGRVDDIGVDLDKVDKRHNEVSETTLQVIQQLNSERQLRDAQWEEEHRKSLRIYQIITAIAVLTTVASLVMLFVK